MIDAFTRTPDSEYIGYIVRESTIRILNTVTGELKTIFHSPDMVLHNLSFSCDKKTVGFVCDEKLDGLIPNGGPNYAGFRDKMFALKKGVAARIGIDGKGYREVFRDTCWVNHFQFSPADPSLAMFCHEGPWNEVLQRIWLIDMETEEGRRIRVLARHMTTWKYQLPPPSHPFPGRKKMPFRSRQIGRQGRSLYRGPAGGNAGCRAVGRP